jgi:hypothetical protein
MRTVFQLASVLACAFSMDAQITATLKRFPARSSEVAIRMDPGAQGASDRAPFVFCIDTAVDADRLGVWVPLPLAPNQEYEAPVTGSLRAGHPVDLFEPPIATAAIFADGTTAGDASLLTRMMLRRSNMLQAVELVRGILSDAVKRNVPRGQFIAQFQMMADSLDHWYLPPEQQVDRTLYQSIAEKLINMRQLQAGAPFPPAHFVEQEIATLNRRRKMLLAPADGCSRHAAVRWSRLSPATASGVRPQAI